MRAVLGSSARSDMRLLVSPQSARPLRPDAAGDPALYRRWFAAHEAWRLSVEAAPQPGPEVSLLLVIGDASPRAVRTCIRSVFAQTVPLWRLSATIVGSPSPELEAAIGEAFGEFDAPDDGPGGGAGRVNVHTQPAGTDPATAYAAMLEDSLSPAFVLLDPDDELALDAVAQLSAALIDADIAYADGDRADSDGLLATPELKPDWSPELLLAWRYTGRPVALRSAPVAAAGGIRPVPGGDWEHDLMLRVTERTSRVVHLAAVLCHRHADTRSTANDAGEDRAVGSAAVDAALLRRGETADVSPGPLPRSWTVRRRLSYRPVVSAVVPFRDSTTLLRTCVDSLLETTTDVDLELVLVDNGSSEPETATLLERLGADERVLVRRDDRPFNWAALNNAAAEVSRGEVLLFVNDDIEALEHGWLGLLAAQAMRPEVGAVGARLLYPDGRVQHAGIVIGMTGATGHVLAGLERGRPGYFGMAALTRDVSAVTGACMATRRDVFERLNGFEEGLWLDFNDVDYCLRARSRGLRIVYEAGAELVHRESPSRGTSGDEESAAAFVARWSSAVQAGDPFYNRNLSRMDFSAALDEPGPVAIAAVGRPSAAQG